MAKFIYNLASSIDSVRLNMSREEYDLLVADVKKFIEGNKSEPPNRQADLFNEKYGNLLEASKRSKIVSIEKTVKYIKNFLIVVLVIIPIAAAIILAVYSA